MLGDARFDFRAVIFNDGVDSVNRIVDGFDSKSGLVRRAANEAAFHWAPLSSTTVSGQL